ncbi:DUF6320 domain-containing protein [Anaerobium acetethylicum]|uniref:Uncharacterized protein n=1 Tax=Anaerobium acetethylicum TaxID=1619234 RepID=A0A1D3TS30_9FIRM|nr:DUF6320 domain-containing protein [Anaerobium acetethylicum]SCP96586.1 hypothetical protein SAMN05421730_1005105 [Anaerobium acetethylicum]
MSYCVHCGVELDRTEVSCPLCNTPVNNPNQPIDINGKLPYPTLKGQVDPVKRGDSAILLTVVLLSTAVACGALNLLVFKQGLWSLYIIGLCALLWVFFIPVLIYSRLSIYLTILFDWAAVALYCWIIYYQFPVNHWFLRLAVPIISLLTAFVLIFTFAIRYFKTSILSTAFLVFAEIAGLGVGLEIFIRMFLNQKIHITWSAVVLVCCIIIDGMLFTILKRTRLREEVRRRMHI